MEVMHPDRLVVSEIQSPTNYHAEYESVVLADFEKFGLFISITKYLKNYLLGESQRREEGMSYRKRARATPKNEGFMA